MTMREYLHQLSSQLWYYHEFMTTDLVIRTETCQKADHHLMLDSL